VILFPRRNLRPYRRLGASVVITLVAIASGCGPSGSSNPADGNDSGTSPKQEIMSNQMYKYEGEGKAKRKVEVSRRERIKLIREAKKAE
jgi:hypothetical protein